MANCEKCGRVIPDGEKKCVACREMNDHKNKSVLKSITLVVLVGGAFLLSIIGIGSKKS